VLPVILAEPAGVADLVERLGHDEAALGDVFAVLSLVSLEHGASDLRAALRTFENHGTIALKACRRYGPGGLALVALFGPVLEALKDGMSLDQSLLLLEANADFVAELLQTHRPQTVASYFQRVAAAGLIEEVGGSPAGLRLVVEQGVPGERALKNAGPDAAEVVLGNFTDPTLRRQAVAALGKHGPMALAMLEKFGVDPDFCDILRAHGAAVIPPIAQAVAASEAVTQLQSKQRRSFTESLALVALFASGDSGQAAIRTIKQDGIERMAQLTQSEVRFYQFLPLYDVIHLGNVVGRGYAPTTGELSWAMVDGCFVVADVLSLAAVQPEAALAAEAIRSEVKTTARLGVKSAGRELAAGSAASAGEAAVRRELGGGLKKGARDGVGTLSGRIERWWAVRSAGGLYQVMRRLPESLPLLSIRDLSQVAGPLCARAGMRLGTWAPVRFLREGAEVVLRIPPEKGLKYLAAQALQAGVGVVGFRKMEEHLSSRRRHSS
jgi:hypothetical protein